MTTDNVTTINKNISLKEVKEKAQEHEAALAKAEVKSTLEDIQKHIEKDPETTGILCLLFDENSDPEMYWGGAELDLLKVLGAVEIARTQVTDTVMMKAAVTDLLGDE